MNATVRDSRSVTRTRVVRTRTAPTSASVTTATTAPALNAGVKFCSLFTFIDPDSYSDADFDPIPVVCTNGVFPLTQSDSDTDILSDPIIMETIKICRNWHTGSDSDISVQILMGTVPIFSDRKENLNRTVSVNAR